MTLRHRVQRLEGRNATGRREIVVIGADEAAPPPRPGVICVIDPRFPKARGIRNDYTRSTASEETR